MANIETLEPSCILVLSGRNITDYVQPYLVELTYTDALEGESDTLDVAFEAVDRRWLDAWYPEHGDTLEASIGYRAGYKRGEWLACGGFQIDEVTLAGGVLRMRALAAGVKHNLRTNTAKAYDELTLKDIAQQVAERNGLKLVGDVAEVAITRVTQAHERDLPFLRRLADEYGHAFTVRGDQLCMFKRTDLKAQEAILTLRPEDVATYDFSDRITAVVERAQVAYHDPKLKELNSAEALDSGDEIRTARHSRDARRMNIRAENPEQAQLKADAALERANEDQTTASFTMMGSPLLVSGINFMAEGWGRFDGKYQAKSSTHSYSRMNGYGTAIECRRVRQ